MSSDLYETDNGRILCFDHLGTSARYTYRDLSGRRIMKLTPAGIAAMKDALGPDDAHLVDCETCRAEARR